MVVGAARLYDWSGAAACAPRAPPSSAASPPIPRPRTPSAPVSARPLCFLSTMRGHLGDCVSLSQCHGINILPSGLHHCLC